MAKSSTPSRLSRLLSEIEPVESYTSTLLSDLILINQIPAPTFHEVQRATFVKQRLEEFGLKEVHMDSVGNVCAEVGTGDVDSGAVLICANLDTDLGPEENIFVSIDEEMALGAGVARNGLGVAGLVALAEMVAKDEIRIKRNVILAATVAQEGEGHSRGMHEVAARYRDRTAFAICIQGLGLQRIGHRSDARFGFEVRCTARRDDRWHTSAESRAIGCLSDVLLELYSIPLPKRAETALNIFEISGGARSSMKADAVLRGELTASDDEIVDKLDKVLRSKVEKVAEATQQSVNLHPTGRFRHGGLSKSDVLVRKAVEVHGLLGLEAMLGVHAGDGSLLSEEGVPTLTLGLSTGGFLEDGTEYVDIPPIASGLRKVLLLAMSAKGRDVRKVRSESASGAGRDE
jgi:tripeptide aminopeptidase